MTNYLKADGVNLAIIGIDSLRYHEMMSLGIRGNYGNYDIR